MVQALTPVRILNTELQSIDAWINARKLELCCIFIETI